jgi:hypothetical protein
MPGSVEEMKIPELRRIVSAWRKFVAKHRDHSKRHLGRRLAGAPVVPWRALPFPTCLSSPSKPSKAADHVRRDHLSCCLCSNDIHEGIEPNGADSWTGKPAVFGNARCCCEPAAATTHEVVFYRALPTLDRLFELILPFQERSATSIVPLGFDAIHSKTRPICSAK